MATFKVGIKPTVGGEKFTVEVTNGMTVEELKDKVAGPSSVPAAEQRLIYKGQVIRA